MFNKCGFLKIILLRANLTDQINCQIQTYLTTSIIMGLNNQATIVTERKLNRHVQIRY